MTTPDYKALCAEMLAAWEKGDDIVGAMNRARLALAEGAGAGPTDDSIETDFRVWFADTQGSAYFGAVALVVLIKWTRHLLARYGTHPRPIPVAERPWEREGFCDAEGRCWFSPWHQQGYAPNWRLIEPYLRHFSDAWGLPAHALPTPAQEDTK
jgi:hypothetical protein